MNFRLDENFPKSAVIFLHDTGHSAARSIDFIGQGAEDVAVFELAQHRKAILLTTDRDFFHTIPYLFPEHNGVVVVALKQPKKGRHFFEAPMDFGQTGPNGFSQPGFPIT